MATSSPESARRIQKSNVRNKRLQWFHARSPEILPEHMDEAEFKQRYESVESPAYHEVSKLIDARIAETPIYKVD